MLQIQEQEKKFLDLSEESALNSETRQNFIFLHGCQPGQTDYDPQQLLGPLNESLLKTVDR